MSFETYLDDVQNELHRMRRANKDASMVVWLAVPIAFVANAMILACIVWGMSWVFGTSVTLVGVTCAAYVIAVLGWAVHRVQQRSNQMAVHAILVHNEVLTIKELIHDEQRRSAQWKS
jgi:hypothetical protein